MRKILFFVTVTFLSVFTLNAQATLMLSPSVCASDSSCTTGVNDDWTQAIAALDLLYKAEADTPSEEGPYSGFYTTTFDDEPLDPSSALIEWNNTTNYIISSEIYLMVKDGDKDPGWYLFDISSTWNRMDSISLTEFWPNDGAISHVGIYGSPAPAPEPATMFLFGTGIAGLVAIRRKRK